LFFGLLKIVYWTSKPALRLGEQCEIDGLLKQRNWICQEKIVLSKLSLIWRRVGLVWSDVCESYAGSNIATGRVFQYRHVKSNDPEKMDALILQVGC